MQNDYYALAHEQAAKERAELRIQIEKLLARDGKLEKLVECLKDFLPAPEPTEPASDQQHAQEQHAPEHEHAGA